MHELTLHVQSLGSKSYKELITMNSNNMHDKIADFIRFVGDWDFRHGEYYLASQRLEDLKACSKSLDILLDMG